MNGGLGVTGPQAAERCKDITEDLICGGGVLVAPAADQIRRRIGQIQIKRGAGKQVQRQGRMAVGGQATSTLRTQAFTPNNLSSTTWIRFINEFESISFALIGGGRPSAAQWHSAIGKLNQARQREAGHWHRPTGHTPNCHQAVRSVWWPHSDLSHRRAIPYPTGKRHSGVDAALQPDLLRHRSTALPARSSVAEHPSAGDANGFAPQHDQQGVPPTGMRWRGGSHGRLRHLRARPAKAPGSQDAATHPESRSYRSRQGGAQMC